MNLLTRLITAVALSTLIATVLTVSASAAPANGIRVVVEGLRNDHGQVGCSLFNRPDGFPRDRTKKFRGTWAKIHGHSAYSADCDFAEVPKGAYAVAVLHDENSNGQPNLTWIGLPTEGYGFSNDAKPTFLPPSAPSYKAASFEYSGNGRLSIQVHIVYLRSH